MDLNSNNTTYYPLSLDGLQTITADSLNLNVGAGVLVSDSIGDISATDTIELKQINAPTGLTVDGSIDLTTGNLYKINGTQLSTLHVIEDPSNLYYTTQRSRLAITSASVLNGLSYNNSSGVLSLGLASNSTTGALSYTDFNRFSSFDASKWNLSGTTIINNNTGAVNIKNNLIVSTTSTLHGPITGISSLNISGNTLLNGPINGNSSLTISGTSLLKGATTITSSLNVNGNETISANLLVSGTTTLSSDTTVKGILNIDTSSNANTPQIILIEDIATNKFGSIDYTASGDLEINNNFATGSIISSSNFVLPKDTGSGKKVRFDYGSTNAGANNQGIEWKDLTTSYGQLGLYGGQNTMYFYAGGSQKMSIGSTVDFSAMPTLNTSPILTDNIGEGTTNLYYTNTRFDNRFATKTTTNLAEGTNLYYTTARAQTDARNAITGSTNITVNNTTGQISLGALATSKWGTNVNDIYSLNSGNVGIGTSTPLEKLEVNGNIEASGTGRSVFVGGRTTVGENGTRIHNINNNTYIDNRGTTGNIIFRNDNSLGSTERMRIDSNGWVGIGTSTPFVQLHISGQSRMNFNGEAAQLVGTDHTYIGFYPDGTPAGRKGFIGYPSASDNRMVIFNNAGANITLDPNNQAYAVDSYYRHNIYGNISQAELTTQFDNTKTTFLDYGQVLTPTESVNGTITISGTVPYNFFNSYSGSDGSYYIDGSTSNYIGLSAGVGSAIFSNGVNSLIDFTLYIKSLNGTGFNYIVNTNVGYIFINNSKQLGFGIGASNATFAYTFNANTWYQITLSYNQTTGFMSMIVNGTSVPGAIAPAVSSTLLTYHRIGANTTAGFVFYINNYRFLRNTTLFVQDALPLATKTGGTSNVALLRIVQTNPSIIMNRSGYLGINTTTPIEELHIKGRTLIESNETSGDAVLHFKSGSGDNSYIYHRNSDDTIYFTNSITPAGMYNGTKFNTWRALEIVGPSPYADAYTVDSATFTKNSTNERILVHYRFSSYASTAGIWRTYFYIYTGAGVYTNYFDFNECQWSAGSFTVREYSSGVFYMADALPAGTYKIRFSNPSQLRMDFNDMLRFYVQQTVVA